MKDTSIVTKYYVLDTKTNLRVSNFYKTRKAASKKADSLDLKYGAVRYQVKPYFVHWIVDARNKA